MPSFRCLSRPMSCSSSPVWHSHRRHRLYGQTAETMSLRLYPKGSTMTYCPCLHLPPVGLGLPWVSVLPYQGLLQQEGCPLCTQPFHRASSGSRAATVLVVAFSAVLGLGSGCDGACFISQIPICIWLPSLLQTLCRGGGAAMGSLPLSGIPSMPPSLATRIL